MRYLALLLLFFAFQLNAQEDLDLDWGPTYNRQEAERQHFFYLGQIGDHYFLRTGTKNKMLLHKLAVGSHKVVKRFSLEFQYEGLDVIFDRFIYLNSKVYGYFKVPDPDNSQLILIAAPFTGEEFGPLREIFRQEFIKIPAIFQRVYPFTQRDWMPELYDQEKLVYSPDSSYVAYANYETPRGYNGFKPHLGYHVVVFGEDFEIEQEMTFFQKDSEHGRVQDIAVNKEGAVYGIASKFTRKGEWKGKLEGKNALGSLKQLVYLDGTNINILDLDLGRGRGITTMDLRWKQDGVTLQVVGIYTDGVEKSETTGYYIAEGNRNGVTLTNVSPFNTDMVATKVSTFNRYEANLGTQIVDKKIDLVKKFGSKFSLLTQNCNSDGTISWVFERKYTHLITEANVFLRVNSVFLYLHTDAEGNLINERLIDRFFVELRKNVPPMVTFWQHDKLHLVYPNTRSLENRRDLDENLKGGGLLEYLVLEPHGETAHFEVLQSNLSYFFDYNLPIAYQGNHILFGQLSRNTYSFGSFEVKN